MNAFVWYVLGVVTVPAFGAVATAAIAAHAVVTDRWGWFLNFRVYDPNMDPERSYWPGEWQMKDYGPIHIGTWSHVNSRWISVGKRGGRGISIGRARNLR